MTSALTREISTCGLRIAYLAKRPIPSRHANSVQIMRMCEAFAQLGHEVRLYATPGDPHDRSIHQQYGVEPNFSITSMPEDRGLLYKWRFLLKLIHHADREIDLFYGRDVLSLAAVAHLGRPLVFEAHQLPRRDSYKERVLAWLFARQNFSHLVCVSSTLADQYVEHFPRLAAKSVLVAPSPAAEFTEPEYTAKLPGRDNVLRVGFVGRPYHGKGIEEIILAAPQVPQLDFHIVGAAPSDLHWIENLVPANVYLHGYVPPAEVPTYYRSFDIVVAPYGTRVMNLSRIESAAVTSPLKLVEYMAAGLPIIVSDLPGVLEIVDNDSALIIPAGDNEAFVGALRRLADDDEMRRRLGRAARQRHRERYTTKARARSVLANLTN